MTCAYLVTILREVFTKTKPLSVCIALLSLFLSLSAVAETWYVAPSGSNGTANDKGLSADNPLKTIGYAFNTAAGPGDTILVMDGVYRNGDFGSGALDNGPAVFLNNSGTAGNPIVLKNHPGHSPVIEFDGAGGFVANSIAHVEISGFTIRGPAQAITFQEAIDHRLDNPKPKYYNGRGIAIWGPAHHITIRNNVVHDCPASGIRINKGDYLTVSHNQVYGNTRYTSSAESALVIAEAESIDESDTVKIRIENNRVWDNQNLIPFFTPDPPDVGIEDYGTEAQDYIIDGSGVYMTRNKEYTHGWFYLANNISFNNGINGLVIHRTDRAIVVNNTCYMNGATPLESGRQSSSGLTLNHANHVRVYNNISWARFEGDFALGAFGDFVDTTLAGNLVYVGTSEFDSGYSRANPHFLYPSVDPDHANFSLRPGSPAIGAGVSNDDIPYDYIPATDFFGTPRETGSIDIGAVADQGLEEPTVQTWPTASEIVSGQTLSDSALTGGMAVDTEGAAVAGSFVFVDPSATPEMGTGEQDVFFVPADQASFAKVPGTVSVNLRGESSQTSVRNVSIAYYVEVGLSPSQAGVATFEALDEIDSDGDGQQNWEEYRAGTDANNPSSRFEITHFQLNEDQTLQLQWTGGTRGPFPDYVIETTTDLLASPAEWTELQTVAAKEGLHEWTGTEPGPGEGTKFFRVRAGPLNER